MRIFLLSVVALILLLLPVRRIIAAEAGPATQTKILVHKEFISQGTISQSQYGQFVEYLCDLVPSMWSEKLYDTSFEGLTPYKVAFIAEKDFREKPWYPSGQTDRAQYSRDPSNPLNGSVSQKIAVIGGEPCTVGISQDGLYIDPDQALLFSIYLRAQGLSSPVYIRLHHEDSQIASVSFSPSGEWKQYQASLKPSVRDTSATITISFQGPGTLWLDNASLMPQQTKQGWREDVVEATRALRPAIIRFGGSALDDPNLGEFEWKDTIGDISRRRPFRAWGGLQPLGAGFEEVVQFMQLAGTEPLVCVRVRGRTPKDAAEQVEYFNGSPKSAMGKLRAANGHPEPYGIKYWQIGNEQGGAEYEKALPAFCQAMKNADPTIKLLASYPSEGVLRNAGQWIDFVCPHHYDCTNVTAAEQDILRVAAMCRRLVPDRQIKLAITEWNTTAGAWGTGRSSLWSLKNALLCSRYHNMLHRQCDLVEIANRSNLINSFCSGIIQTDNHRIYFTPTYYAQKLYATLTGERPLKVESAVPGLDVSATFTVKTQELTIFLVHLGSMPVDARLDLSAFGVDGDAQIWTLGDSNEAAEADAINSFSEPNRVRVSEGRATVKDGLVHLNLRGLSLTVLRVSVTRT